MSIKVTIYNQENGAPIWYIKGVTGQWRDTLQRDLSVTQFSKGGDLKSLIDPCDLMSQMGISYELSDQRNVPKQQGAGGGYQAGGQANTQQANAGNGAGIRVSIYAQQDGSPIWYIKGVTGQWRDTLQKQLNITKVSKAGDLKSVVDPCGLMTQMGIAHELSDQRNVPKQQAGGQANTQQANAGNRGGDFWLTKEEAQKFASALACLSSGGAIKVA